MFIRGDFGRYGHCMGFFYHRRDKVAETLRDALKRILERMNATKRLAAIDAILAGLPKIQCQRKCGHEVCGPIMMSPLERKRIEAAHGKQDFTGSLTCPLFKDGQCSGYSLRPTICHLWGLTPRLACHHGCVPERWLSEEESRAILDRITELGA